MFFSVNGSSMYNADSAEDGSSRSRSSWTVGKPKIPSITDGKGTDASGRKIRERARAKSHRGANCRHHSAADPREHRRSDSTCTSRAASTNESRSRSKTWLSLSCAVEHVTTVPVRSPTSACVAVLYVLRVSRWPLQRPFLPSPSPYVTRASAAGTQSFFSGSYCTRALLQLLLPLVHLLSPCFVTSVPLLLFSFLRFA